MSGAILLAHQIIWPCDILVWITASPGPVQMLDTGVFRVPCSGCAVQHKTCNASKNDGERRSIAGDTGNSFLRVGGALHSMMTNEQ